MIGIHKSQTPTFFISGVVLSIGSMVLGGTLIFIIAIALGLTATVVFCYATAIGIRHLWGTWRNKFYDTVQRIRYQCWEHLSYKEVWQSDRASEPEDLHAKDRNCVSNGASTLPTISEQSEHNGLKTD